MADPDLENVDILGDVAPQGFSYESETSESDEEDVTKELLYISALIELVSIHYIYPEITNMFHQKEGKNVVILIKILMIFLL